MHVHHTFFSFLYISLQFLHDYNVKMPNFRVFWRTQTSNDEILFLFLNLDIVPWNSTSGGLANF